MDPFLEQIAALPLQKFSKKSVFLDNSDLWAYHKKWNLEKQQLEGAR